MPTSHPYQQNESNSRFPKSPEKHQRSDTIPTQREPNSGRRRMGGNNRNHKHTRKITISLFTEEIWGRLKPASGIIPKSSHSRRATPHASPCDRSTGCVTRSQKSPFSRSPGDPAPRHHINNFQRARVRNHVHSARVHNSSLPPGTRDRVT